MLKVNPNILVDADALFDTVAGTLNRLGPGVLATAIQNGYFERRMDKFEGVNPEEFKKLYDSRDAQTLALSMTTNITSHIQDIITQNNILEATSPWKGETTVYVNVFHYDSRQPMPDRVKDLIKRGLLSILEGKYRVEVVSKSMEELTLLHVERDFGYVFFYNPGQWYDHIAPELESFGCPQLNIRLPMIMHVEEELPSDSTFEAEASRLELLYEPFFNLEFLPIEFFSMAFNPLTVARQPELKDIKVKGWDR